MDAPKFPTITSVGIRWHEGYANKPTVDVSVDGEMPRESELLWHLHERPNGQMVLTSFHSPWAKFRAIDADGLEGNPSHHGNMGGTFRLDNGETLTSRTGWSSRAGAFNHDPQEWGFPEELIEVTVMQPGHSSGGMFSYSLIASAVQELFRQHLPHRYLIHREDLGEPIWIPSCQPNAVVKPSGYVCR